MAFSKRLVTQVTALVSAGIVGVVAIASFPLSTRAQQTGPNGSSRSPEPGWSLWKPKSELGSAGFSGGFSNSENGAFLDFEAACRTAQGVSDAVDPDYWFRLSNTLARIGTGAVEFGCWHNGEMLSTVRNTAVLTALGNVTCLRVGSNAGTGLVIRAEPTVHSRRLGVVRTGRTVRPISYPALILPVEGRNWVAIQAPMQGWVSDDSPTSSGNLELCSR